MDDLEHYRMKIGMYIPKPHYRKLINTHLHCQSYPSKGIIYLLLVITCTIAWSIINDPGIEMNPGPLYTKMNPDEQLLFREIKKLDSKIAAAASHRYFLSSCIENNVTPRGYKVKMKVCTSSPTDSLQENHKTNNEDIAIKNMSIDLNHYNDTLPNLQNSKLDALTKLRNITSKQKYEEIVNILQDYFLTDITSAQKTKLKKIDNLISSNQHNGSKICHLDTLDLDSIISNEQLDDKIIDAAMKLVMQNNPIFNIQSSNKVSELLEYSIYETIHIHHNGNGHWITSSSIGGQIIIYDSLNLKPTDHLLKQITVLYSHDHNLPPTKQCDLKHTQIGYTDCGLFAIAYAVDLSLGNNPADIIYDQNTMRKHLSECFLENRISSFPRHRVSHEKHSFINCTKSVDETKKWSLPKKSTPPKSFQPSPPIPLNNQFTPLHMNTDFIVRGIKQTRSTRFKY